MIPDDRKLLRMLFANRSLVWIEETHFHCFQKIYSGARPHRSLSRAPRDDQRHGQDKGSRVDHRGNRDGRRRAASPAPLSSWAPAPTATPRLAPWRWVEPLRPRLWLLLWRLVVAARLGTRALAVPGGTQGTPALLRLRRLSLPRPCSAHHPLQA